MTGSSFIYVTYIHTTIGEVMVSTNRRGVCSELALRRHQKR